ncbi:MAG: hypothetical protein ACP5RV_12255 [Thiomonas sp.]
MSLLAIVRRIKARSATPETPKKNTGFQREPAPLLACTLATPETSVSVNSRSESANDAHNIDRRLADLLREHGGYPSVRWDELELIDATKSPVWVVLRPAGLLTVLVATESIGRPRSYTAAWPARFASPEPLEPVEDAAPAAAEAAAQIVARARQSCWGCTHFEAHGAPSCAKGHPVCWRRFLTRTHPSRSDKLGCADQSGRES